MNTQQIKGIIFDYGATLDTNGLHWFLALRKAYAALEININANTFADAYSEGETTLNSQPIIKPTHNFWHVIRLKATVQIDCLKTLNALPSETQTEELAAKIADWCYAFAQNNINIARPTLKRLAEHYPLAIVSNFYGNLQTVLEDFRIREHFTHVFDSGLVGIRKPDPQLFTTALAALGLKASETAVVGDSHYHDIAPAAAIGCTTIWLRDLDAMPAAEDQTADIIIPDFRDLTAIFNLQ
jgi:putative hydrolase of the HAD superfamily